MRLGGLRLRRHHHLGEADHRLPHHGAGHARVRAPRLPAWCGLLLVHLLPHAHPLPLRALGAAGRLPRREVRQRRRPSGRLGAGHRRPRHRQGLQVGPRQGRDGARGLGRGHGDRRGRLRPHHPDLGSGQDRRVLRHPGHVSGLLRSRRPPPRAHRRHDALLLRLVRRPAAGLTPGLRGPDRRSRGRRLVQLPVPHDVGLQPAADPHPGRTLHDRGPLPRAEGRGRLPPTTPTTPSSPTSGCAWPPAPTAPWPRQWGTSS